MKRVTIIVRSTPFNTINPTEAFRTSVGLTIKDNIVTVILLGDGVTNALSLRPDLIQRPDRDELLGLFKELHIRIIAEREALHRHRIQGVREGIEIMEQRDIFENIMNSDVVISF